MREAFRQTKNDLPGIYDIVLLPAGEPCELDEYLVTLRRFAAEIAPGEKPKTC